MPPSRKPETTYDSFAALDIRAGKVVGVELFPEARKPAYKLTLDFGPPIGRMQSSAQLTARYRAEELTGTSILAVVNFPARRIAGFKSECLVLGVINPRDPGDVVLVRPHDPETSGWVLG